MTAPEIFVILMPLMTPVAFLTGACIGSFLNVVVWRVPRGESLVSPPSHCPRCDSPIKPWQNIPVLSWLLLRGRCFNCKQPISRRYPIVEFVTACLYLMVWFRVYEQQWHPAVLILHLYLVGALIAVTLIDLEHLRIPNIITFTGMGWALVAALIMPASRAASIDPAAWTATGGIILNGLLGALPGHLSNPRLLATLDVLSGLLVGGLFLWAVHAVGRRLWGYHTTTPDQPQPVAITPDLLTIGDALSRPNGSEAPQSVVGIRITATNIRVKWTGDTQPERPGSAPEKAILTMTQDGVAVGHRTLPWTAIDRLDVVATRWATPREVLGLGDVKLMAMLGAFLGADAVLFIALIASAFGCITGALWLVVDPDRRQRPLPFGPFLATGAGIWVMGGAELVILYQRFLNRLLGG